MKSQPKFEADSNIYNTFTNGLSIWEIFDW